MMGWVVSPADEEFGAARLLNGDFVSPGDRAMVIETLQEEVDDLLDDAAGRGVDDRSADAMLLMLDILGWLRGEAEPPGWAATELLEVRVALFNEAQGDEEEKMRKALLEVLLFLVAEQVNGLRYGRLGRRRINIETAAARDRRRFGASLEHLRTSNGLEVGDLASGAGLDPVTIIGLLRGARAVTSAEILLLADALAVDPAALLPDRPGAANPAVRKVPHDQGSGGAR